MSLNKAATVSILLALLAGCTWVKIEPGAERVRIIDVAATDDCELVASTTVSVRDRVAGVQRKPGKVQQELEALAKNSAHETGANALLPLGPVQSGKREYAIYRC
ncbi:MAG: DUF4156 domain-containing protein [Pseudomonadota bacterium]